MMTSYYGKKFQGKRTSSGEIFDMNKLTCAHKTLPFGTRLKVINESNGKSVVVRVNDRGPFVAGRDLDLSFAAARKIGLIGIGVKKGRTGYNLSDERKNQNRFIRRRNQDFGNRQKCGKSFSKRYGKNHCTKTNRRHNRSCHNDCRSSCRNRNLCYRRNRRSSSECGKYF
ncbi:MAG: hypothetical protein B6D62_04420 [Candidatus Cloacimonas sp. 4484_275]|nr:MAG: hypothetical protein B6D62_04420 [Candidatus Cloacimonas sp. 4484_275]